MRCGCRRNLRVWRETAPIRDAREFVGDLGSCLLYVLMGLLLVTLPLLKSPAPNDPLLSCASMLLKDFGDIPVERYTLVRVLRSPSTILVAIARICPPGY